MTWHNRGHLSHHLHFRKALAILIALRQKAQIKDEEIFCNLPNEKNQPESNPTQILLSYEDPTQSSPRTRPSPAPGFVLMMRVTLRITWTHSNGCAHMDQMPNMSWEIRRYTRIAKALAMEQRNPLAKDSGSS